jgi:omega-6 fatty acid desaturase (delta-12 desaturase)
MNAASGKEVHNSLQEFTVKRKSIAIALLVADFLFYILFLASLFFVESFWFRLVMGPFIGLMISGLFVLGHDAAHNNLTDRPKLNKWLGRLAFLPSLHNFSQWQYAHNKVHHAFTNYKQRDNAYIPLSPDEYLNSSFLNRMFYALNRTSVGHATYYLIDYWFAYVFFPKQKNVKNSRENWLDFMLLFSYLALFCTLLLGFNIQATAFGYTGMSISECLFFGMIWPFIWWNWWMGFAIYQHHTNEDTKWFNKYEEWHYWEVQLFHSTHIKFPLFIELAANNIMKHTAHHANMNIPCYQLHNAQLALEERFGDQVKIYDWNMLTYFKTLNKCKLYDYETHKWLTFREARKLRKEGA